MGKPEMSREPCPDRILDDVGLSFVMGTAVGSAIHLIKGAYNFPKGNRFFGGMQAVSMNAPRLGGGFAAWGGLFSTIDCTVVYLRQKEDPWNSIISGDATSGVFSMRKGFAQASRAAVFGGCFFALFEGALIMVNKKIETHHQNIMIEKPMSGIQHNQAHMMSESQNQNTTSSSSWFGGLFGKKNERVKPDNGSKTEVLESFDAPPVPSFEHK